MKHLFCVQKESENSIQSPINENQVALIVAIRFDDALALLSPARRESERRSFYMGCRLAHESDYLRGEVVKHVLARHSMAVEWILMKYEEDQNEGKQLSTLKLLG